MDEVILKGLGYWLLALIESIVVFLAFLIGQWTDGISTEFAILLSSILGSSQILVVLLIRHFFGLKIEDEEEED